MSVAAHGAQNWSDHNTTDAQGPVK